MYPAVLPFGSVPAVGRPRWSSVQLVVSRVVDNAPPVIGSLKAGSGAGQVRVQFDAADRSSTLAHFAYTVDSSDDWQTVLPTDKIADSPEETYSFSVPGLSPGSHQIAVRVCDAHANQAFANISVTIPAPTASK